MKYERCEQIGKNCRVLENVLTSFGPILNHISEESK